MMLKLIVWNLIVFVSIVTVLLLTGMHWWTVLGGSLAYTTVMAAVAYVYGRVWQAIDDKQSVKDDPVPVLPTPWNYYDLVAAMIIGSTAGWLGGGVDK